MSRSQHEPTASRSSILGLDALTFLMADMYGMALDLTSPFF
jgi:hypothetical protein